jgi:Rod binding domain-containing protein
MNITSQHSSTTTATKSATDFLYRGPTKSAGVTSEHDRLTEQARKWVATSFYGTLLKQAHASPFKDELFSGGRGGEAFQSLQDQQLADHMTRGVGSKIVNAIVRKIEQANLDARRDGVSKARANLAASSTVGGSAIGSTPSTSSNTGGANVSSVR